MSYISADTIRKGNNNFIIVWERHDRKKRISKSYEAPYYFFMKDVKGKYESIYGDKLKKITCKNSFEYFKQKKLYSGDIDNYYELDIEPKHRVLSEHYYNAKSPPLNITFFDIEVDYDKDIGFASADSYQKAYSPINSIALEHYWTKEKILLTVPPPINKKIKEEQLIEQINEIEQIEGELTIYICRNEFELLQAFITLIENSDVISGWNSSVFDLPYIGWRLIKMDEKLHNIPPYPEAGKYTERSYWSNRVYIEEYGNKLKWFSKLDFPEANLPLPDHKTKIRQKSGQLMPVTKLKLNGRIDADYLELFKKYELAERPSYSLEAISREILPKLNKMEYRGTLSDLYYKNYAYFCRYNIRDTEILSGFEDKLGYLDLANTMYHISCGTFEAVTGTIKLADLAIINYCHHELNQRVPTTNKEQFSTEDSEENTIAGAFVLDPKVGMHDWIGAVDITSLYPSSIRSINISPEMIIGQFTKNEESCKEIANESFTRLTLEYDDQTKDPEIHTAQEWKDILLKNKWCISGFGTVFDQKKKGFIPAILEDWFATRKKYQKLMKECSAKIQEIKNKYEPSKTMSAEDAALYEKYKEEESYYNKLQNVFKIKLNSLYGALTNKFFKFYDLRMGESTTGTGRFILLHQCAKINELLTGEYNPNGEAVIYGDTDSTYFKTFAKNKNEAIKIADLVASKTNDSYQEFMQKNFLCQPDFDNIIKANREIVASKGIFIKKKRYILRIVDNEGIPTDKLKVMGVDTKRTNIPREISEKLNKFVEKLLKDEEWNVIAQDIVNLKEEIKTTNDIMSIGISMGVQNLEKYTKEYEINKSARLPGHVAASIHYNIMLENYNDKISEPIKSGMKIKIFNLTEKVGKFKSIALPTDLNEVPSWFIDNYHIDRDAQIQRLVDKPLSNILAAINKKSPTAQDALLESLLNF